MTTGAGHEGAGGQHVISMRSTDRGATWSAPVDVEPADGPEASYAVMLKVPSGRVYCFYNHNTDNVREVKTEDGKALKRVDSLGHYVFKFSDDHGRSWSAKRYDVAVREFACDRENVYGGKLRFFWNVGRPLIRDAAAILVLHKVCAMGAGFFAQSEGAFLRSENILTERDPEKITFETLPAGDIGLRTPPGGGRVAEEQSISLMSDGSLYCVYRTIDGWPTCSYSRDGGYHWSEPAYLAYWPGGRRIKHPRAANFAWRCSNGKYLYWFHNHGGIFITPARGGDPYRDRNPAWLAAGVERDGPDGKVLHWSQPEIVLYDDDPYIRMSYPDLIEEDGHYYLTETQKNVARVHEIPPALLAGLFDQFDNRSVAKDGLLLDLPASDAMPAEAKLPRLPAFHARDGSAPDFRGKDLRAGFSIDAWLSLDDLTAGQVLLDSRDNSGEGIALLTVEGGAVEVVINDGRSESRWRSDRGTMLAGRKQHLAVIVDGGPRIIIFVVDGVLCDGGDERQFGWGRFSPQLNAPNGASPLKIAPAMHGSVERLRIYGRALRTSEAIGNFHAGPRG